MVDCLVIGAGPSGVSAALAVRAEGWDVVLVYKDAGRLEAAPLPESYYGVTQSTGQELFECGLLQAKNAGITLYQDEITGMVPWNGGYKALGKGCYEAKTVILANGTSRPQTPAWLTGDMISAVGTQAEKQGALYRNRMVGVVGAGAYGVAQAKWLSRIAKSVTLFTDGQRLQGDAGSLSVNEYPIAELLGEGHITGVGFVNGVSLNVDGLFLANRVAGVEDLLAGIAGNGSVFIHADGSTNLPGIFALPNQGEQNLPLPAKVFWGYQIGKKCASYK